MTEPEFREHVRAFCRSVGGQQVAAQRIGISAAFLCDFLHSKRRAGIKISAFFGVQRAVLYLPIVKEQSPNFLPPVDAPLPYATQECGLWDGGGNEGSEYSREVKL